MIADTIAAISTPTGVGGVGVLRLSGAKAHAIGKMVAGKIPNTGEFSYRRFQDASGNEIDQGLVLCFSAPSSFTGEDVIELQGHGGPVPMAMLLNACLAAGARQAEPGEFSQRAFLNDRIDLTQAEAIADLINSATEQAARGAVQSIKGEFSNHVRNLEQELINFRVYIEAAIDFPEEEIDFLASTGIKARLKDIKEQLKQTVKSATTGELLQQGVQIALIGEPNVGKSSLFNALVGSEAAIVTEVPGTTRDIIAKSINLNGLLVHLLDTAGMRDSEDAVEKIGIDRAREASKSADLVLELRDCTIENTSSVLAGAVETTNIIRVNTKADLVPSTEPVSGFGVWVSSKTGQGIPELIHQIKEVIGFSLGPESAFSARKRHINLLNTSLAAVERGEHELLASGAGELLAEELRLAHDTLGEITGKMTADTLLGEIFSNFCIGK
ncbi:MAG: tRNA uridine-5-carboxymethylaminomethyl(34) synthesis GTPase MnmE [Proteobacteria bacterium]|nr:tRNA uridine-5-carboxymethylaminomethyl(34) synthesis GTPase MnmE [Pseudomonadota bacterium]